MSVNRVEALKKVYYNLSQQNSKGNTVAEVLQDIYAALSEETTKQSNVTRLIDMISEYAEGGGGGGGGDFSIAKVTGINTTEFAEFLSLPILTNTPDGKPVVATFGMPCDGNQYDVVLYKGLAYTQASGTHNTYSAEGDCVITEESGDYIISITGDCIITISEA